MDQAEKDKILDTIKDAYSEEVGNERNYSRTFDS